MRRAEMWWPGRPKFWLNFDSQMSTSRFTKAAISSPPTIRTESNQPCQMNSCRRHKPRSTVFRTVRGIAGGTRQALLSVKAQDHQYYVVTAEPLQAYTEQLEAIARIFWFAVPAALLVAGLGGFLVARKSLAPVVVMSIQRSE
jgi:hypothetical protein